MIIIQIILLVLGFVMLIKGADWFVEGTSGIAAKLGIPQLVIGLTIVAIGTSAPEAAVSITASLKGTADIAIGNIVGSNIFNILFVIGTSSIITPVIYEQTFLPDGPDGIAAVLSGILLLVAVLRKKELRRIWGVIFLLCYTAYFACLLI